MRNYQLGVFRLGLREDRMSGSASFLLRARRVTTGDGRFDGPGDRWDITGLKTSGGDAATIVNA
jgi:hypothetical protein